MHWSCPVDRLCMISVSWSLVLLQLSFLFCRDVYFIVLYMRVVLTCLWKNFMNIVLRCSCTNVMCYDILRKCSKFLHVFKPGVIALQFIDCELRAMILIAFCIWRLASCLMGSHVGPRAGCGCCMPCEVVACIVVLPMPVGILMGVLACFWSVSTSMICRNFAGFAQLLPLFECFEFSWICSNFSPFSQYMKLHVTVMH